MINCCCDGINCLKLYCCWLTATSAKQPCFHWTAHLAVGCSSSKLAHLHSTASQHVSCAFCDWVGIQLTLSTVVASADPPLRVLRCRARLRHVATPGHQRRAGAGLAVACKQRRQKHMHFDVAAACAVKVSIQAIYLCGCTSDSSSSNCSWDQQQGTPAVHTPMSPPGRAAHAFNICACTVQLGGLHPLPDPLRSLLPCLLRCLLF